MKKYVIRSSQVDRGSAGVIAFTQLKARDDGTLITEVQNMLFNEMRLSYHTEQEVVKMIHGVQRKRILEEFDLSESDIFKVAIDTEEEWYD